MKDRPIMDIIREREALLEAKYMQAVNEFKRDVRAIKPDIPEAELNEMALRALARGAGQ